MTNKKLHMRSRLASCSMTLNCLEFRLISHVDCGSQQQLNKMKIDRIGRHLRNFRMAISSQRVMVIRSTSCFGSSVGCLGGRIEWIYFRLNQIHARHLQKFLTSLYAIYFHETESRFVGIWVRIINARGVLRLITI